MFFLRGCSFYCTCPGRNWDRLVISSSQPRPEVLGVRGLFCCISVHFFCFVVCSPGVIPGSSCVPTSNALSVSVKRRDRIGPIAV